MERYNWYFHPDLWLYVPDFGHGDVVITFSGRCVPQKECYGVFFPVFFFIIF